MKAVIKMVLAMSVSSALFASAASAASWQDQLSNAASSLGQNSNTGSTTQSSGTSLGALTGLLNGGNQSLSSNSMTNAAGVLEYCVKNNVVNGSGAASVKDKLLGKLGLTDSTQASEKQDYQQGLTGLLNTGNNQQVNLSNLGSSPVAEKVKTKACDLVLKQSKQFIS